MTRSRFPLLCLCTVGLTGSIAAFAQAADVFATDASGVVRRSDIVLQRPNAKPAEAMPLGNGQLGAAVWTANGLTVQLNRGDSFPDRLSSGQVVVPGLAKMTAAHDFNARLDMYDGEYRASGGGMSVTVSLDKAVDALEIVVKGADPATLQTAQLNLWQPRHPTVGLLKMGGVLAETWQDNSAAGATGATFGTLAAITADAADTTAAQTSPVSLQISFHPAADGGFRLVVAAPQWAGGEAQGTAEKVLAAAREVRPDDHLRAWHSFWSHAKLMELSSLDGAAEYFENLRVIDLYTAAAESTGRLPGSQAGIGDLFSSIGDKHQWGPADYWHWNMRMQVAANLGAGVPELNESYFRLYRENLPALLQWTSKHMGGRQGICIPETMRFNGQGFENESWLQGPAPVNCGEDSQPYYNARTISTGAEVALWVWEQYRYTGDLQFLRTNYPILRESARFLLAYAKADSAGVLHTYPANAHENSWDVHDPVTDIAAMRTLFPAVAEAADLLKVDAELAATLRSDAKHLPALPVVSLTDVHHLVPFDFAVSGGAQNTILAESYDPDAVLHNVENVASEAVWPYGLLGDDGPAHALGVRTFLNRRNKWEADWSFDPIQAARLGLAGEVEAGLHGLTQRYQAYPSGLAKFAGPEFYVEQIGVLADALQESLAQDYDGLLRFAPAWPADWSGEADVALHGGGKTRLRLEGGQLLCAAVQVGNVHQLRVRNPWPGKAMEVVSPDRPQQAALRSEDPVLTLPVKPGSVYLLQPAGKPCGAAGFPAMTGEPGKAAKKLGDLTIGLPPASPWQ